MQIHSVVWVFCVHRILDPPASNPTVTMTNYFWSFRRIQNFIVGGVHKEFLKGTESWDLGDGSLPEGSRTKPQ